MWWLCGNRLARSGWWQDWNTFCAGFCYARQLIVFRVCLLEVVGPSSDGDESHDVTVYGIVFSSITRIVSTSHIFMNDSLQLRFCCQWSSGEARHDPLANNQSCWVWWQPPSFANLCWARSDRRPASSLSLIHTHRLHPVPLTLSV